MQTISLAALLSKHTNLGGLVDPTVREAVGKLNAANAPSEIDLAGACLGNAHEAIGRLLSYGIIPGLLDESARDELRQRYRLKELTESALRARTEELAEWLGLPAGVNVRQAVIPNEAGALRPLFRHQRRAVRDVRELLQQGQTRVLLHMPTGAGKTRTTMSFVCETLRAREDGAVLWVASTSELCEQAANEFVVAWQHLGNRSVPLIQAWGGTDWDPGQVGDGLVVGTPQTLYSRKLNRGANYLSRLGSDINLIVFDEAHQAIADTYRASVEHLAATGKGAKLTPIIGLSATPGRTLLGSDQDEALAAFFHHNKVKLDTSHSGEPNPVRHLVDEGYLAAARFELLVPEGRKGDSTYEDINVDPDDDVASSLEPAEYLALVADAIHALLEQGHKRILVFAASVELSDQLAAVLRATGVRAESVHGATPHELRAGMISRYRSTSTSSRVLVNFGVLTTGFDAPMTSAAVIARPTRSLVLYSQMVGRAIRGPKAGGNEEAKIITVVDPAVPAFGNIAEAFSHWESLWNE